MRIGFDLTALYAARGGIPAYDGGLARALLAEAAGDELLLLDYWPLHGRQDEPPQAQALAENGASIRRVYGLRHRQLARWGPLQESPLRPLAALADQALFRPWRLAAAASMRRRLVPLLAGLDVFHTSEVLLWRQEGAWNAITVYDLTALLFPAWHTAETRQLQERKARFVCEQADGVVVISETTRRDVVTHLGVPPERVYVVPPGVDPSCRPIERELTAAALAPLGLRPGEYILHVGTIEPRKNLTRLAEAYELLRRSRGRAVPRLVLAGAPGWMCAETLRRLEALGQDALLLGSVPAAVLPALYNGARLLVYPSLYEGFGLPVLEAMACGTPVVASSAGALPEVVGDAGLLVDPQDMEALAAAMGELLADAERRAALRRAGLARAAGFSWARSARRLLEVYWAAAGDPLARQRATIQQKPGAGIYGEKK